MEKGQIHMRHVESFAMTLGGAFVQRSLERIDSEASSSQLEQTSSVLLGLLDDLRGAWTMRSFRSDHSEPLVRR